MKYAIHIIRTLIKNERFIFSVMLICVFVSAWVMTFSYGLYHNYSEKLSQESNKDTKLLLEIADGKSLTRGDLVRYLNEVSPKTLDAMDIVVARSWFVFTNEYGTEERKSLFTRFVIRNGSFIPSPYIVQLWDDDNLITSGRYISKEEEENGEKVIMLDESVLGKDKELYSEFLKDDETFLLNGEEYKIIGTHISIGFVVPLLSLPESESLELSITMRFEKPITKSQYDELYAAAQRVVPDVFVFPEMELADEQNIFIYNNMLAVSVLVAVLTIINFAFLYSFILQRRGRTLAIMRMCGCTRGQAFGICMGECCLICIPTFLIGELTYIPLLHVVLGKMFEFIEEAYSLVVYGLLFAIFVAVLLIVMGILLSRQIHTEIAEGRKGGAV